MRPPVSVRRLLVLLLIGALASAGPLAYASPPDPAWIAGFWDDGDYDDVVLLATSGVSIADPRPSYEPESVAVVIAVLSLSVESPPPARALDRKSTRLNSSHLVISYAVFCLKKKRKSAHKYFRIRVELNSTSERSSAS